MSTLSLTFLGTSAAAPTADRNLSGLFLTRDGDSFLVDTGEGTQRQMIRFRTGFSVKAVFFTHFHADHYLGIIGFLRTLGMLGLTEPLVLYGPKPAATLLPQAIRLGLEDAEASRELGERRVRSDLDAKRELVRVGERAAGVVLKVLRHLELCSRRSRERSAERERRDELVG